MHVLSRDLSYEEVAEIFVRVNSLGVKLRGSDLALAQITARWPNSLKLLEEFQDECEKNWITLDLGLLVRSLVVFATGQSRFETVRNIAVEKMKHGWELAKDGLRFAINFLRTNADIEDESLLSSPLFFVAIAYFSYMKKEHPSPEEEWTLLQWLYTANAKGRYSRGSSETLLDADLATLRKGGSAAGLIETVGRQFGRLDFDPVDFKERGAGSPLFSLVFLALKKNGAKDWKSGLGLSLTHQGKYHYIQYHHIFPKSRLKGSYETREINEIANMAFVSGRANRQIGNRDPVDYLPEVVKSRGDDALAMQLIPMQKDLWALENYRAFLEKRRMMLAEACNAFIANVS
jgi:hypothetical protein